ncbi:MAG: DUF2695 domain-containing protein [Kofleriaceae bacterium]|nr:DUF2695 domain-containing protein [Kofleriaceae bacterium]
MDKVSRKRLKQELREQQRRAALRALPLAIPELEAMFDMLNVELPLHGCDHSRRLTQSWLLRRGHDVEAVFAWLDEHGGYCDCEVLANVEQHFNEARATSRTAPD